MRTKVTLVLLFLNVALFFFIFKFERPWRVEANSLEARRLVLGSEADNIQKLEINRGAAGSFSLVSNRDNWFLAQPLDWPANPHAVNSILQDLRLLEHESSFRVADLAKSNQSLADYGLDQPKITVAFVPGSPTGTETTRPSTVLRIGDLTPDRKRLYVLSTDGERVHVVGRSLIDTLSVPLDQLRANTLLTIQVFEARSLVVQTANPDQSRGNAAASVRTRIRREASRWNFDAPINVRASKTAVDLAINELNALKPRTFKPAGAPAVAGGTPELRITLEGNNRQEILLLREPVVPTEGAAGVGPASIEYEAELEGRSSRFTVAVPVTLLDALRNAQLFLREKRILDELDTQAVTSITLVSPLLSSPPLTLQKLDATAGAAPDAAPQWLIQRTGGAQGPQPVPADRAAIQRLLERLALLSADHKLTNDAPTSADLEERGFNRPERLITLTFTGNRPPIVLGLGTDNLRNVYARVGTQTSIYKVNIDLRRELPLEIPEWRDRTLRAPLPPGARFTTLKVTDLVLKQAVFGTAINPAGDPDNPPRDPKALQDVLGQLRTLRAKSILPTGFTDRIPLAGEERAWRYQLDYTIALPGGGGTETTSPPLTLFFTDRLGGAQQYAGSRELDVIFEIEQPLLDAFWALVARDPGPPGEAQAKE